MLKTVANEIFKTINNLNPSFIKGIFTPKPNDRVRPNDMRHFARFGTIYTIKKT